MLKSSSWSHGYSVTKTIYIYKWVHKYYCYIYIYIYISEYINIIVIFKLSIKNIYK